MIYGVTFTIDDISKHTFNDWGLLQVGTSFLSPPEPMLKTIEIPGKDGMLDFTDMLDGTIHYKTRTFKGVFRSIRRRNAWKMIESEIMFFLHGRYGEMKLDDDFSSVWKGRFYIDVSNYQKNYFEITINGLIEPYKHVRTQINALYKDWEWDPFNFEMDYTPIRNFFISTEDPIILKFPNRSQIKRYASILASPQTGNSITLINVNGDTDYYYTFSESYRFYDIPETAIVEGENTLEFTGTGYITLQLESEYML